MQKSRLQKFRESYKSPLPDLLKKLESIQFEKGEKTTSVSDQEQIQKLFPKTFGRPIVHGKIGEKKEGKPLKVGVVFSGGQAAGGHNVIAGLFDALKILHPKSQLFGFLGGPSGIVQNKWKEISEDILAPYRNQGGFDLIGSGRTKIETEEQLQTSLKTMETHRLDGLVIIGGDDSNTNAAILAEYFLDKKCPTRVIGVPKTIDGDLKNAFLATSFGFDTAAKVYAEMIGNLARDALSAKKYYHFVKLMGRSASHLTLECALATHPNITLIGEEVEAQKQTLSQITQEIADIIINRAKNGLSYGIVLIPEGLIEFIPEIKKLIQELNALAGQVAELKKEEIETKLSQEAKECFALIPKEIQKQLLLDRDPHGNVQVSLIETEKLLIQVVEQELAKRGFKEKFAAQSHFFGYEGRSGFPSNFDAHYCQALGYTAALLINEGLTGYMACIGNLHHPVESWSISGLPITLLMYMEMRKGKQRPVIQKALVDLQGKPFAFFKKNRASWAEKDQYRYPGPIQFFGSEALTDSIPLTMQLEIKNS